MRRRIAIPLGTLASALAVAGLSAFPAGAGAATDDSKLRVTEVHALATESDRMGRGRLLVDVKVLHPPLPERVLAAVGEDSEHLATLAVEGVRARSRRAPATAGAEATLPTYHANPIRWHYRAVFSMKDTNALLGRGSPRRADDLLELRSEVNATLDVEGDGVPEHSVHGAATRDDRVSYANLRLRGGAFKGTSDGYECEIGLTCHRLGDGFTSLTPAAATPDWYYLYGAGTPCGPQMVFPSVHTTPGTDAYGNFYVPLVNGTFTGQFTGPRAANTNSYSFSPDDGAACASEGRIFRGP